jgi:hypothetical protein
MLLSLLCAQDKVTWGLQLYIAQKGRSLHARTIDKKRGAVFIRELFLNDIKFWARIQHPVFLLY